MGQSLYRDLGLPHSGSHLLETLSRLPPHTVITLLFVLFLHSENLQSFCLGFSHPQGIVSTCLQAKRFNNRKLPFDLLQYLSALTHSPVMSGNQVFVLFSRFYSESIAVIFRMLDPVGATQPLSESKTPQSTFGI